MMEKIDMSTESLGEQTYKERPESLVYRRIFLLLRTRYVLSAMIFMQVLWLAAIWLTGASDNSPKLMVLGIYSIIIGLFIIFLPTKISSNISKLAGQLQSNRKLFLVTIVVSVLLIGVYYARFQRGWYWDEDNSYLAAKMIAQEGVGVFFKNYTSIEWLGKHHPPLAPLIYGFAMYIFGVNLIVIRLMSLVFLIGILITTYYIGRELYDGDTGALATVLLLTFPLMLRLGTAALLDVQVTFFFSLSLLLLLFILRMPSLWLAIALGLAIGLGLLTKYTMVSIYLVLFGLYIASRKFRCLKFQLATAILISGLLFLTWLFLASQIGVLAEQQGTASGISPGYFVRTSEGIAYLSNFLFTKLTSALGPYNLPLIFLGGLFILWRRNSSDLFIFLWTVMVGLFLVAILPDHRYFMLTFPALAIMMAVWLKSRPEMLGKVVLLAILYGAGALWLFIDWQRAAQLFTS